MFILLVCTSKHCLEPLLLHSQVMISQLLVKDGFAHLSLRICTAENATLVQNNFLKAFVLSIISMKSIGIQQIQYLLKKYKENKDEIRE